MPNDPMVNVPHILSPMTAPWCGWSMLVLLLFAILSEWMQPGVITQAFGSLKVRPERMYKDAPTNVLAQMLITVFRVGTVAMALCMCLCPYNRFTFTTFAVVCGIVVGVLLIKMLCNIMLDYTFQLVRKYGDVYEHYSNILTLTVLVLYPLVLLFMHIGTPQTNLWLLAAGAVLFLGMWLYRSARQFVQSPMALLFLLVYTATMEVLPMAGIVLLSAKTITIL